MRNPTDHLSNATLNAMLDYLSQEIETAQTKEELQAVLSIAREMLAPPTQQNAVYGLQNIRAEVDRNAIARAGQECVVQLHIPHSLSETFHNLSTRMRTLQNEDPDTFANATNALTWLASGKISAS